MDISTLQTVQMNWGQAITIIGTIVGITIGALLWMRKDIKESIKELKNDISDIKIDIKNIDARLNRLEGAFFERGQWEAKAYKINKQMIDQDK